MEKKTQGGCMKHTKEPWKVHLLDRQTMIASDVENGYLAETRHIHSGNIEEANAKRIVACVNACAGITNEALEAGVIKEAMELFWRVSDKAILDENNQMTYKGDIIFASDKEEDV